MAETTGPESARIWVQAIVRSKNDVKNGAITRTRSMFLNFQDLKAMAYASGYAIASASNVARAA